MNVRMAPKPPSPLHRLWRLFPAERRRRLFAAATAAIAPRPDRPPPAVAGGIAMIGEFSRASGLGESARLVRHALAALGVPTWTIDIDCREMPNVPPGVALLIFVNPPMLPYVLLRLPRRLFRGRRIIGNWAWELPTMPDAWRSGLSFVHEVWAISRFTADAIRTLLPAGSDMVVRNVSIPVAIAPPRPSGLTRADFGLPEDAVIVLTSFNLASSRVRKNPDGAIVAFKRAFGSRPDRILVLKIGNPTHFPADFAELQAAADAPNIRILTETLPVADAHALTACVDIVLSLHRSEGFGLVPAEAMLLGVPVIATAWSGNLDFMDQSSAALVPYTLIPACDPRGVFEAPGAVWAEPDIAAAAAHLTRLADNPEARAALGKRGRDQAQARLGLGPIRAAVAALGLPRAAEPVAA